MLTTAKNVDIPPQTKHDYKDILRQCIKKSKILHVRDVIMQDHENVVLKDI